MPKKPHTLKKSRQKSRDLTSEVPKASKKTSNPSEKLRIITKLYRALLIALPVSLFFSYHPVISFGSDSTMNFELSLPLIVLALFDLTAVIAMIIKAAEKKPKDSSLLSFKGSDLPGISDRRIFLFSLLPFYATVSIFWSANPLRGALTAGIIWLIFFAIFSILYITPLLITDYAKLRHSVVKTFFIGTAAVCLFCFLQSILDVAGVAPGTTLICRGCTFLTFGFPHPSGFAIEPQFMGNLLLAPTLLALYLLIFREKGEQPSKFLLPAACLFSLTLFFTFSRGAIYAYALALLVLLIFAIKKQKFRLSLVLVPVCTFIASLILQGTFAAIAPTSETFSSGIAKSVHQLSLGLIDFRKKEEKPLPSLSSLESALLAENNETSSMVTNVEPEDGGLHSTYFDGYVTESTNTRLALNRLALRTWSSNSQYILLGTGLGGAGKAMHNYQKSHGPISDDFTLGSAKEIVQNEPLSLLLELGLMGFLFIAIGLILAFAAPANSAKLIPNPFWSEPILPFMLALIIAYVATLQFFSGLPNALHIYLIPPIIYSLFKK